MCMSSVGWKPLSHNLARPLIIVLEKEERRAIEPLVVAQALALLAVYGGMFSRFPCPLSAKVFVVSSLRNNDSFFYRERERERVSLLVFQASSGEEKNSVLCSAVYDILAARFGTWPPPPQSQKHSESKLRQHDRALKEVTCLKNEAR